MTQFLSVYLPEFFYVLCGLVSFDWCPSCNKK